MHIRLEDDLIRVRRNLLLTAHAAMSGSTRLQIRSSRTVQDPSQCKFSKNGRAAGLRQGEQRASLDGSVDGVKTDRGRVQTFHKWKVDL